MSETATSSAPGGPAPIGKLDADRLCQKCLHQMHGALVYRDPGLDLLYVRCTECGIAAAVTEYPVSWRWVRRFGILLAGIIFLIAFALLAGDVAAHSALTYEMSREAVFPYSDALQNVGRQLDPNATWMMPPALLADQAAINAVLAEPELAGKAWRSFVWSLLPVAIVGTIASTLWTVILFHRRWWVVLLFQCLPLGLAAAFGLMALRLDAPTDGQSWSYTNYVVAHVGPTYGAMMLTAILAVRMIAVLLMKPLMRLFLWLIVPKRVRLAIASVWTDDPLPGQQ